MSSDPWLDPPPDGTLLWRYVDFARFAALVLAQEVRFARADQFEDPWEMGVPVKDRDAALDALRTSALLDDTRRHTVAALVAAHRGLPVAAMDRLSRDELAEQVLHLRSRFLYVSSWHENATESAAMWDLYLRGTHGVAVVTSVSDLFSALDTGSGERYVFLGRVQYLDYQNDSWGPFRPFHPAFHKRASFAHEREVRAVVVVPTQDEIARGGIDPVALAALRSLAVPVDLARLCHRIVVDPRAPAWFVDLCKRIVEPLGLAHRVQRSDLYDPLG